MTPRENFIAFLTKQPYEWTPTSDDELNFRPTAHHDNIVRAMVQESKPYTGEYGGTDYFGVEWVYVPTVGGSMEKAPLFEDIEDWEKYVKIPDPDAIDWEGCAKENAAYLQTDKLVFSTIYTGYFERLISFVGFENAAMALLDEDQQACVHALFDKLTDYYIEIIRRMHKYWNVGIVEVHDDWGNQRSLMFSAATHEEMIMPYMQKIARAAHAIGVLVEQHSCGKIEGLMPNIVKSEVDTWRGQASVVDKKWLVDNYGDQFRFGVEIRPEPDATEEEQWAQAKATLEEYHGKDVWIALGRTLRPAVREKVRTYIKEKGHI